MSRKDQDDPKRRKGDDKRKNTEAKYGKNTTRGLRHAMAHAEMKTK